MKLWKMDLDQWTVRQVEGGEYPAKDSDGETCFGNTHFADEGDAWKALEANAKARVELAGRAARELAARMRRVEAEATAATVAFQRFSEAYRRRMREVDLG